MIIPFQEVRVMSSVVVHKAPAYRSVSTALLSILQLFQKTKISRDLRKVADRREKERSREG